MCQNQIKVGFFNLENLIHDSLLIGFFENQILNFKPFEKCLFFKRWVDLASNAKEHYDMSCHFG